MSNSMLSAKKIFALALALAALSTTVSAQSRSSFINVTTITGVQQTISNSGLTHTITIQPGASFTVNNVTYSIKDIFGFWSLSNTSDLISTANSFGDFGVDTNNAGTGGIAGWKANPNKGITVGQSKTFSYQSLNTNKVDQYGFHVRLTSGNFPGTSGNTGYITTNPVPEPTSMIALGGMVLMSLKRRKK